MEWVTGVEYLSISSFIKVKGILLPSLKLEF